MHHAFLFSVPVIVIIMIFGTTVAIHNQSTRLILSYRFVIFLFYSDAAVIIIINPRRVCAARVTVVVLCVCLSVHDHSALQATVRGGL